MKSSVVYAGPHDLIDRAERDGFFVLRNFFDRAAVEAAQAEIEALLDADDARRAVDKVPATDSSTPLRTIKTKLMHTMWFPTVQSPAFKRLVADAFGSAVIQDFLADLAGSVRLRVDLARRASGSNDYVDDFQIPHEWHRDTPGEFTFGIFLDDMTEPNSGGTACIQGTHWDRADPRWDLMLGETTNKTRRHLLADRALIGLSQADSAPATLNKEVREACRGRITELLGRMGDLYFFMNETWHGRAPNLTGQRFKLARIGGFATDFPFKDDIPLPETVPTLPEPLCSLYARDPEPNTRPDTLMQRLYAHHRVVPQTDAAAREKDAIVERVLTERRAALQPA